MGDFGAKAKGFSFGLLVGGAMGAAAALLWAPQAGQGTRRFIKDQAKWVGDSLFSALDEIQEVAQKAGTAIPSFGDKETRIQKHIDELKGEIEALRTASEE